MVLTHIQPQCLSTVLSLPDIGGAHEGIALGKPIDISIFTNVGQEKHVPDPAIPKEHRLLVKLTAMDTNSPVAVTPFWANTPGANK